MGGRRLLGPVPRLVGRPWEVVARDLQFWIDKLQDAQADGIPAGFGDTAATIIEPDDSASAGTLNSGWAASDHTHGVNTAIAVSLGLVAAEGAATAFSRSDHVHPFPYGDRTVTASTAALTTDFEIRCDATAGAITITLPAVATSTNLMLVIKKIDATVYTVIIDGNLSELVEDALTQTLYWQGETLTLKCTGVKWDVI